MRALLSFLLLCLLTLPGWADDRLLSHSTDFARVDKARWAMEGWRVESPDPDAMIVEVDGVLAFVITEPHRAMAWTLTTEPLWMDPFATLAASYFVEGGVPADAPPPFGLFDGSTGPITPGATNTENPLASGGRYDCGTFTAGLHIDTIDLAGVDNLERVGEITITVQSGDEPVVLRLNQLAFLAQPQSEVVTLPVIVPVEEALAYTPLALPQEGEVGQEAVRRFYGLDPALHGAVMVGGHPFLLGNHAVPSPLDASGEWTLEAAGTGNTLAFLCATRLWGSGQAWYSKGSFVARRHAPLAHQFKVTLVYADGQKEEVLPRHADSGKTGLQPGLGAYTVPVRPGAELASIRLTEGMSFGQVVLLAASRVDHNNATVEEETPMPAFVKAAPTGTIPEDALIIEGPSLRLVMDRQGVVHRLQLGEARQEIIHEARTPLIQIMGDEDAVLPLTFLDALRVPTKDKLVVLWQVGEGDLHCEVSLRLRKDGGLECAATLTNRGETTWKPDVVFPQLRSLRVGNEGAPAYVLGGRSTMMDTRPVTLSEVYGGRYPNQLMDVYDGTAGGGLACIVEDDSLERKWFSFNHDASGESEMAVTYRRLELVPGAHHTLPTTVLLPHEGDWHGPFEVYRDWVRRSFPRSRPNTMDDLFYCRRDYPLGGTSYLFDVAKPAYSFEKLIAESRWAFGGVDMVDISGWAYNEAVGRVGTYTTNDLGGLDALGKGIRASHAKGVQVGLYFEGYLLDKRARNAAQGLAEWQLIRGGNKPAWWPGDMEFFCCPGAEGWQDALAADIAEVARVSKADAVYVDQLGICDVSKECWSANHDHPVPSNPIQTEIALLKRIRTELDKVRPECAIYIEHIPCDAMTPYIDGAFSLGMKHTMHPMGPTKLPLHRYLQPSIPVFEMVAHGIRPIPAEEDDLKLAFFHGMGLWLKGRGASWYSESFREKAGDFYPIYQKFGRYFRSADATPHIDTLAEGVYANAFPHDGNVLYTLYNANDRSVAGPLLALPDADGKSVTSLVDGVPLTLDSLDDATVLLGSLPPQGVAGVVVMRD